MVPPLDGCYPWQSDCEWTFRNLWRWMGPFGRLDVILLALMLLYVLVVSTHVFYRCYLARVQRIDRHSRSKFPAVLNIEVGSLRSISFTSPYFGLAGTCVGILSVFGQGFAMAKHAFMVMITTEIALALIPTIVAIPLAVLATCSYNFLRTFIDLHFEDAEQRQRSANRLPRTRRFSELPTFGLIAAPGLAMVITGYMTFASFHTPTGYSIELASGCEYAGYDRLIVLQISDSGKLFLNQEPADRNSLTDRLWEIYGMRKYRTLYLLADSGVPFQTVADVIDTVERVPSRVGPQPVRMTRERLGIKVQLITPQMFNSNCVIKPVAIGSGHHRLR